MEHETEVVALFPADREYATRIIAKGPPRKMRRYVRLKVLQDLVGGCIEYVRLREDISLVVNEEGKIRGLEYNDRATLVARAFNAIGENDWITGDAVLLVGKEVNR